jgi:defect-in-organelle-trafficking protein DotC
MSKLQRLLCAATVLGGLGLAQAARAGAEPGYIVNGAVPPMPSADQSAAAIPALANPLNQPITGAREAPDIVGGEAPPSLESLQATRPGDEHGDGLEPGRAEALRQSGCE